MDIRYSGHPNDVKTYDTSKLRQEFLIDNLFLNDEIKLTYSHVDRVIVGGIMPIAKQCVLEAGKELGVEYFLERREVGIVNIGSKGAVVVDGVKYELDSKDGLYIGMGAKEIYFSSAEKTKPAKFYFNSVPAHKTYETKKITQAMANSVKMGSKEEANERTIYQYIHPKVLKTCQLIMGMTELETGSIWNTMPCHTHERRMEVYLYFDMLESSRVFHFMGNSQETRHIIVGNEEAVISPSWSIHAGAGTRHYTFIWGMAGENQEFTDMDIITMQNLK